MNNFNVYILGVGGQGLGLLSEIIIRAGDYAGYNVCGVDTHGLAQRGGTVESFVRFGDNVNSPLIMKGQADIVLALEKTEALRGMRDYLKDNGTLVYYDTSWQTLEVRVKNAKSITNDDIEKECENKGVKMYRVYKDDLDDTRMQNIVLLGEVASNNLIEGIKPDDYKKAIVDLLGGKILDMNLAIFESAISS